MSAEKRTRWDTSDDKRDAVGREVFPTAEVREAGTFSVARWSSIVYVGTRTFVSGAVVVSSSSSYEAERRLRAPPLESSTPGMFAQHATRGKASVVGCAPYGDRSDSCLGELRCF